MVVAFIVASWFMAIDASHVPPNAGYTVDQVVAE